MMNYYGWGNGGWGMMDGGWGWFMGIILVVWLVVGVLAAIWLWQKIKK